MRRIPRLRQPKLLCSSTISSLDASPYRQSLASPLRTLSTTSPSSSSTTTEKWRSRLWKGKAPGPADPYGQSSPASTAEASELEAYEADMAELESHSQGLHGEDVTSKPKRPASRLRVSHRKSRAPDATQVGVGGYKPAFDSEGLETVGGYEGWWEKDGYWGPESLYTGFSPSQKVTDPSITEVFVRQAVLEALAVRRERDTPKFAADWPAPDREALDRALEMRLKITEDGIVALRGNSNALVKGLTVLSKRQAKKLRKESTVAAAAAAVDGAEATPEAVEAVEAVEALDTAEEFSSSTQEIISAEEAQELAKSWDPVWKTIGLSDTHVKFAINKRIFQMTGHLVPDAKLARIETVGQLLDTLVRPPPAKKLAETLQGRDDLVGLPNVQVFSRRVTPIDREKAVGRWKIIEKELTSRGLPVTGHKGLDRHHEARWVKGNV